MSNHEAYIQQYRHNDELKQENARLREQLAYVEAQRNEAVEQFLESQKAWRASEAKLKALSEQEPLSPSYIQTVPDKCDRIVWRGRYWMLPINNTSVPEPCICLTNIFDNDPETGEKKHCHDCGGTGTVQRADAQFWVDRCLALEAERAELERKLAEQQATFLRYGKVNDTAELNTLLAQAREEGRKEACIDAKRYRWLRSQVDGKEFPMAQVVWKSRFIRNSSEWTNLVDGNNLDTSIDLMLRAFPNDATYSDLLAAAPKPEVKP